MQTSDKVSPRNRHAFQVHAFIRYSPSRSAHNIIHSCSLQYSACTATRKEPVLLQLP